MTFLLLLLLAVLLDNSVLYLLFWRGRRCVRRMCSFGKRIDVGVIWRPTRTMSSDGAITGIQEGQAHAIGP